MSYCGRSTHMHRATPWETPQLPRMMRHETWDPVCSESPLHMLLFSYNFPGMSGISVRFNCGPAAWFAHTDKNDGLSFYLADPSLNSVWIYVPLRNECISALWKRESLLPPNLALGLETDQKRFILLGTQGTQQQLQSPWRVLDVPNAKPSTFFFNTHPSGARHLLFDCPGPTRPRQAPLALRPLSACHQARHLRAISGRPPPWRMSHIYEAVYARSMG